MSYSACETSVFIKNAVIKDLIQANKNMRKVKLETAFTNN